MILVDTSVWIDHLRNDSPALSALLDQNQVVIHPLVLGELACGNLQNRIQLLRLWQSLDSLAEVNHKETLYFIESNQLMGKGVGYIDVQLLASVTINADTKLWTKDKRLAAIAIELGYAWNESMNPPLTIRYD